MTFNLDSNTYLAPVIQIPSALEITNITNGFPMIVTVSANSDQINTYIPGMQVILTVPVSYKMYQANGLQALILDVVGNDIYLNANSTNFDVFTTPIAGQVQPASLAPSGSRNLQFSNTTNQVPFQSYNNIGN